VTVSTHQPNLPDYEQLVKFLFKPFLSEAEAIGVDCEYTIDRHRVWIRVAVAIVDRDSAFGRGGRNIQAIRTILQTAAVAVGQSIHLDVYGSNSSSRQMDSDRSHDLEATAGVASANRSSGIKPTRRSAESGDRPTTSGEDRPSVPPPRPRR
jgi:uncharacterized protein